MDLRRAAKRCRHGSADQFSPAPCTTMRSVIYFFRHSVDAACQKAARERDVKCKGPGRAIEEALATGLLSSDSPDFHRHMSSDVISRIKASFSRAAAFLCRKLRPAAAPSEDGSSADAHKEIRSTIELQATEGAVTPHDAEMLGGVLDLSELQVLDIMVHRTKMATIDISEPVDRIIDAVLASQYSRMPVWREAPDNFVGVLHSKDLLKALRDAGWSPDRVDLGTLLSPPWFVPDTTGVNEQLSQFLKRKSQLALVVDEYGEVRGLVTLEDILEEIVGQIADEHDVGEVHVRTQVDGSVLVEGTLPIRDLNRETGWSLPDDAATTVAGLVMHEAQTIPEAGQVFTFHGFRFEIARKVRNRITAVRIRPTLPPVPPSP
ncbi:MAG: CBS domain-containing protein [Hyphomicrobium sp.]|nr:CBS domain-containing protein [Hyphomicrobium sp.]